MNVSYGSNLTGYGEECKEKIPGILLLAIVRSRSPKIHPWNIS